MYYSSLWLLFCGNKICISVRLLLVFHLRSLLICGTKFDIIYSRRLSIFCGILTIYCIRPLVCFLVVQFIGIMANHSIISTVRFLVLQFIGIMMNHSALPPVHILFIIFCGIVMNLRDLPPVRFLFLQCAFFFPVPIYHDTAMVKFTGLVCGIDVSVAVSISHLQ